MQLWTIAHIYLVQVKVELFETKEGQSLQKYYTIEIIQFYIWLVSWPWPISQILGFFHKNWQGTGYFERGLPKKMQKAWSNHKIFKCACFLYKKIQLRREMPALAKQELFVLIPLE